MRVPCGGICALLANALVLQVLFVSSLC